MKELQKIALNEILPEWEESTNRPDRDWPTYSWLCKHRYSHLKWILENIFDTNLSTFFAGVVGAGGDSISRWAVDDPDTMHYADQFICQSKRYRNWRESTADTMYYLLNRFFREYTTFAEREDFVSLAQGEEPSQEDIENFIETIHHIRQNSDSDESAYKYLRAVQRFYAFLERRHIISHNPVEKLDDEFHWNLSTDGSQPLTPEQVGRLWSAAETIEDYLIIIG
jgi:hypothetical protein